MASAFMTELEAVNMCLAAIGESPVNSITNSGLADVAAARAKLLEFSRTIQSTGWAFNTEHRFPLLRASDNTITLPLNALKASIDRRTSDAQVAQRGQRMYDKKNHTYIWDRDLYADVVFFMEWDELPQAARQYIAICAARSFQATSFTSDTIDRLTENDELKALVALKDAEGDNGDYNMFYDSYSVADAWMRPDSAILYEGSTA